MTADAKLMAEFEAWWERWNKAGLNCIDREIARDAWQAARSPYVNSGGWIPIGERKPEARYGDEGEPPAVSDDVLCAFPDGIVRIANYDHHYEYWHVVSMNNPIRSDVEPTHWMPLPPAPSCENETG